MGFTVSEPTVELIRGKKHITWTVSETDVAHGDEFTIVDFPRFCTLSLYEVDVTDGTHPTGGVDAATVKPELGLAAGWALDSFDEIVITQRARKHTRNQTFVRITSPLGTLVGRTNPLDVAGAPAAATSASTRITVIEGH